MDKGNSVTFALENISLNKIHFELTDNFSYGDLEFNIELGYKEDEAEYLEKKTCFFTSSHCRGDGRSTGRYFTLFSYSCFYK